MASLLIFFLLFLLPFCIAPFGITQFENPKVIFAEIGVILLFLIVLFRNKISGKSVLTGYTEYIAIFLLTLIDLCYFKTNISFFGNAFRMQGIFLLWILLLFSFLSGKSSFKKIPWWVFCLLLYGELLVTFFLPLNASQRYVGTLGEPNALAAFAIFVWPFGWFAIPKNTSEITSKIVVIIPVSILLYLSGSRSGMVAFGIELLSIFLLSRKFSFKSTFIICLAIYLLSYILPFFDQTIYENRTQVWEAAIFAGIINPALGYGFGNTETVLHNAAAGLNLPIQYYYVDSSHNIFLDWLVQGGIIGMSLLIYMVSSAFGVFIKKEERKELILLLGMIVVLSFNPASVVGLLGFWWLLGRSRVMLS